MLLVKRVMKFRSSGWKVLGKTPKLFLSVSETDWKNYFFGKFFQNDPLHSWYAVLTTLPTAFADNQLFSLNVLKRF